MKSGLIILALVAVVAVVSMVLSDSITGNSIRKPVVRPGEACSTNDICMAGYTCLSGRCTTNSGQMEILPGQLCTSTTPCKFGYACREGRCQRPY